jgi:hypothetical protein
MLRRVALVRVYVSEERSASFIRVTRIGELGTTLGLTSNRRTLRSQKHKNNVACERSGGRRIKTDNHVSQFSRHCRILNISKPYRPPNPVMRMVLLLLQ